MTYISHYHSPLGNILLTADDSGLCGVWFERQKYFAAGLDPKDMIEVTEVFGEKELPVFLQTKRWLDLYFAGKKPDFSVSLHFTGTQFQKEVWKLLLDIPYGATTTYGEIAKILADKRGSAHMSAQAVGGAVGHNKISILVPCHRVLGSDGKLTGYAGGLDKKKWLLELEGVL